MEIETQVLLASAIEDSTDIFRISGGGFEHPKPSLSVRHCRRWWVKPWIGRREQLGASTQLLVELAAEDSDSYRNRLRMSEAQLDFLLQKVSPLIQKADTFLRTAFPSKLKLQITLHYLATGTSFRTLSAL